MRLVDFLIKMYVLKESASIIATNIRAANTIYLSPTCPRKASPMDVTPSLLSCTTKIITRTTRFKRKKEILNIFVFLLFQKCPRQLYFEDLLILFNDAKLINAEEKPSFWGIKVQRLGISTHCPGVKNTPCASVWGFSFGGNDFFCKFAPF